MQYDFIAIGDITTDAFIRLKDVRVHCDINDVQCELCVRFGDKVPYESVTIVKAVGNSPNAAVAAHRLGLTSAIATNLGDDQNGTDCMDALREEGMSTEFVTVHQGIATNYHYVLQYEAERTILIKHEVYPYALPVFDQAPRWIYLSSLGDTSLPFHHEISAYLASHPEVMLAFQPGTFQIAQGTQVLREIYAHTELFVCNKEEAQIILKDKTGSLATLLTLMHELGPKQVVITDGPKGAYASDGTTQSYIPMYPDPAPPVSRTGAGDATASTTAAYLARGLPLPEALMRGLINAMSVVQQVGAQKGLLSAEEIDAWLAKAPSDFHPHPLS
jgi:ribokinase